jgi:hypothetical protein
MRLTRGETDQVHCKARKNIQSTGLSRMRVFREGFFGTPTVFRQTVGVPISLFKLGAQKIGNLHKTDW